MPLHSSEGWMESRVRGGHCGLCPELGSLTDMESGGCQGRSNQETTSCPWMPCSEEKQAAP